MRIAAALAAAATLTCVTPAVAGPGAQQNTPDCYGTTSLAGGRTIDFTAYCTPPGDLAVAELGFTGITSNVAIKSVRPTASFDDDPAGTSCRRGARNREGRMRIACTTPSTGLEAPQGHKVAGRFKLKRKSDRCQLIAVFGWSGGGCVGYNPDSGLCADVGLGAGRRFGPPVGC